MLKKEPYFHPGVPIYKVRVTVLEAHPGCGAKHKVGDTYETFGPAKEDCQGWLCPSALIAIFPIIFAMRYGAVMPFAEDEASWDPDRAVMVCPDANTPVIFEIRRLKDQVRWLAEEAKTEKERQGF